MLIKIIFFAFGMLIDIYFINLPDILKLWQKITFILSYYSYHLA